MRVMTAMTPIIRLARGRPIFLAKPKTFPMSSDALLNAAKPFVELNRELEKLYSDHPDHSILFGCGSAHTGRSSRGSHPART